MTKRPHPIPYQGSKRALADRILDVTQGWPIATLYEPFAGSAALTLAAASRGIGERYVICDTLEPLMGIWRAVLEDPDGLADGYRSLWQEQLEDPRAFYLATRSKFNGSGGAAELLYLLARCVKNAPRFNNAGGFSQSADHRRLGMRPEKMTAQIMGAHSLLAGRTQTMCSDFGDALAAATPRDLVYMDPPWQGTTDGPDKRYHQGLSRERLMEVLVELNERNVPWILSYDGRLGDQTYGEELPATIGAKFEIAAGRSSQATLVGRALVTYEGLYVARVLEDRADAVLSAQSALF